MGTGSMLCRLPQAKPINCRIGNRTGPLWNGGARAACEVPPIFGNSIWSRSVPYFPPWKWATEKAANGINRRRICRGFLVLRESRTGCVSPGLGFFLPTKRASIWNDNSPDFASQSFRSIETPCFSCSFSIKYESAVH